MTAEPSPLEQLGDRRDPCAWCDGAIGTEARSDSIYCSKRCRQAAHRFRRGYTPKPAADRPLRLAYADPPYPGMARRYYGNHPDFAGEVDHEALIGRLGEEFPDGWALSTASRSLQELLSHCPSDVRIAAWFRGSRPSRSAWPLTAWEPVIFRGGRQECDQPMVDYDAVLAAQGGRCAVCGVTEKENGQRLAVDHDHATGEARGLLCKTCNRGIGMLGDDPARLARAAAYLRGEKPNELPRPEWPRRKLREDSLVYHARARLTDPNRVTGAKPAEFIWWLFELLGAQPGDDLVDLFPGSGGISRAWSILQHGRPLPTMPPRRRGDRRDASRLSTPATADAQLELAPA